MWVAGFGFRVWVVGFGFGPDLHMNSKRERMRTRVRRVSAAPAAPGTVAMV